MTKQCPSCASWLPLSEFRVTAAGNPRSKCKKCYNKERSEYRLKRTFGLDPEDWNKMFDEQDGCCAICGMHQSEQKKRLEVDHCHKTGHVRALLCTNCNTAIGKFYDNPDLLYRAADYLRATSEGFQDLSPSSVEPA